MDKFWGISRSKLALEGRGAWVLALGNMTAKHGLEIWMDGRMVMKLTTGWAH